MLLVVVVVVTVALGLLSTGIQDVTQALADGGALNDVLRMVLETLFRALGCRRVLLCLRDASGQQLLGRMGLGEEAMEVARRFKLPLQGGNDLFALVCNKGVDTLISDASAPNVAQRLPAWVPSTAHSASNSTARMANTASPAIFTPRITAQAPWKSAIERRPDLRGHGPGRGGSAPPATPSARRHRPRS